MSLRSKPYWAYMMSYFKHFLFNQRFFHKKWLPRTLNNRPQTCGRLSLHWQFSPTNNSNVEFLRTVTSCWKMMLPRTNKSYFVVRWWQAYGLFVNPNQDFQNSKKELTYTSQNIRKACLFWHGIADVFLIGYLSKYQPEANNSSQTKEVLQQLYCFNLHLSGGLFVTVICWNSNYHFVEFVVKCVRDVESHVWYKSSGGWQSWAFSSGCEWGNWRSSPGQTHIFMVLVVKDGLSVLTRWSLGDVATI